MYIYILPYSSYPVFIFDFRFNLKLLFTVISRMRVYILQSHQLYLFEIYAI